MVTALQTPQVEATGALIDRKSTTNLLLIGLITGSVQHRVQAVTT